jgi:hypothetical protein
MTTKTTTAAAAAAATTTNHGLRRICKVWKELSELK